MTRRTMDEGFRTFTSIPMSRVRKIIGAHCKSLAKSERAAIEARNRQRLTVLDPANLSSTVATSRVTPQLDSAEKQHMPTMPLDQPSSGHRRVRAYGLSVFVACLAVRFVLSPAISARAMKVGAGRRKPRERCCRESRHLDGAPQLGGMRSVVASRKLALELSVESLTWAGARGR
jgi:hypothetical protein